MIKKTKKINIPKISEDEVLVIKVGTDVFPSSEKDIKNIIKEVEKLQKDKKDNVLVTHHAIEFFVIKRVFLKTAIFCTDLVRI